MRFVVAEYAKQQKVSFSDALRLLLEMAISQRVNAVEAQQEQLDRIEEKVDRILGWEDPPAVDQSNYAPMSDEQIQRIRHEARPATKSGVIPVDVISPLDEDEDDPFGLEPDALPRREYYPNTGWS